MGSSEGGHLVEVQRVASVRMVLTDIDGFLNGLVATMEAHKTKGSVTITLKRSQFPIRVYSVVDDAQLRVCQIHYRQQFHHVSISI